LAKAARTLGLKAEGVQVSREALAQVETPAVAWVHGNHYIAVLAVQGEGEQGTALIHDPNAPSEQTIPQEQLLRQCSGYLLLVHR
jgi:ABC-type bacteriocin/lantibiotic exporter with double-glycine peptidase domain